MADLQVKTIDLQISSNKKEHHTDAYDSNNLILRRGQDFRISVELSRPLQPQENIAFITETGPSPSDSNKTRATFPLPNSGKGDNSWTAEQKYSASGVLGCTICSPVSAVIGRYILSVQVSSEAHSQTSVHTLGPFILLFNPWNSGDDVYMADAAERQEYVLNDYGVQFVGNEYDIVGQPWGYSQFERNILGICLSILDQSNNYRRNPDVDVSHRNDPAYICRVLGAMINSKDDKGVLEENWSGQYSGGEAPTNWNGSVDILQKWYTGGYKPVKYGQCWVFGGVLCTVLRSFGIPCRSVTNFNSAQDTDGNLYIDTCYEVNGGSGDSCKDVLWNFHIWNEAWFTRKELGSPYGGWQALDSTPLKKSEGIYRCGPASVKAIKEGDVDLDYDTRFLFAAVSAYVATWVVYSDGTKMRVNNNTRETGKFISTKAIGGDAPIDITSSYKYQKGSEKEQEVFKKASSKLYEGGPMAEHVGALLLARRRASEKPSRDPQLSGELKLTQKPICGQDVKLILILSNLTSESMIVKVHISSSSILYTGMGRQDIWKDSNSVPLGPKEEKHVPIIITYNQYKTHIITDSMLQVAAVCEVEKTDERVVIEKVITLAMPPISIKVPRAAVMNEETNVAIVITNPLPETLEGCFLVLEGYGLIEGHSKKQLSSLGPNTRMRVPFHITPSKSGTRHLLANFTCDKLLTVKGSRSIEVKPSH